MECITTKKMQELDRIAIEQFDIPSLILMENAGREIADLAIRMLSSPKSLTLALNARSTFREELDVLLRKCRGSMNVDSRFRGNDKKKV